MTESLFHLGAGAALVGVTEYCEPPEPERGRLAVIGGTRSADVEAILRLQPDLVLANQEENALQVVEALEAAGLKVWVTFPRSVEEAIRVLWALVRLFRLPEAGAIVQTLETSLAWTAGATVDRVRVFVPIWEGTSGGSLPWWMTFGRDTYTHDLLSVCGADNVFADRERRYPLDADLGLAPPEDPSGRDVRYPRVTAEEIRERRPGLVLLPSEPHPFSESDVDRFRDLCEGIPVCPVDGHLLTWHGTRLAAALAELPGLIQDAIAPS